MAKKVVTDVLDIYRRNKRQDRNNDVLDLINQYINKSVNELNDGLINSVPSISEESRNKMAGLYGLSPGMIGEIKKTKTYKKMSTMFSDLRFGLILSYVETGNRTFIFYLCILLYGGYMRKYFPNGSYNRDIMRYTVEKADNRTDFKKFGSLALVLNKKIDAFERLYKPRIRKGVDDDLMVSMLQSLVNRINDMWKNLAQKYYTHFNNPELKVIIDFTKTADGKNTLSATSFISMIRERSVDKLMYIDSKILDAIGFNMGVPQRMPYRIAFTKYMPNAFGLMSQLTGEYLDEYVRRNQQSLALDKFKREFIPQLMNARAVGKSQRLLDDITAKIYNSHKKDTKVMLNKSDIKKAVHKYCLLNIYLVAQEM